MSSTLTKTTKKSRIEWDAYRTLVPATVLNFMQQEALATHMCIFDPQHISGLLQTEAYARMAISEAGMYQFDPTAVDARVRLRMERQWKVMDKTNPPQITVVLDEATLHRHAHGAEILREQLAHLLELAELPNIDIHVIPFDVGVYGGMDTGSFAIFGFSSPLRKELLFKGESSDRSDNDLEVFMHKQLFERLLGKALDKKQTLALIRAVVREA